ncbi:MAG: hypothetical protein ACO4CS_19300 [bacterium]
MSLSIRFQNLAYGQVRPALADLLYLHCAGNCQSSPDDVPGEDVPHGFIDECGDEESGIFFRVANMIGEPQWLNDYIGLLSNGGLPMRY